MPLRMRPVLDEVAPLAADFGAAGYRLFLVGGIVRDLFGEQALDDIDVDLTTDAVPAEIRRIAGPHASTVWTQGERFGTIGLRIGGRNVEITTHRSESYDPESRNPNVEFGTDVEVDLSRRDFTINAMALEVTGSEPQLIDPYGGLADLTGRRLRTPLAPQVSFSDDPLRMLRAARFIARFGLEPDAELRDAVAELAHRLEIISPERIREELDKLVSVPDPSAGLWFVVDTGLAEHFLPELPHMRVEQDPIHRHKDVLAHSIAVLGKTDHRHLKVRLAALFHDVGKPKTRSITGDGVSFHHHEVVGARMTRDRMKALRYSNEMVDDVTQLVFLHLRIHTYAMGWTDAAVRRYVRDAGPLLDDLNHLQRCDCTTRNKRRAQQLDARMNELEARIGELRAQEELDAIRPPLDGKQVMEFLGVPPGRVVGDALTYLLDLRMEEGPIEEADAYAKLKTWAAEKGLT